MTRTKPTTRKPPSKPGSGVPLSIPLPGGGRATFCADHELTPRRTRPLEVLTTSMAPLIARVATAQRVINSDAQVLAEDLLPGAELEVTEEQAGRMARLNDVAVLAYLKTWTLDRDLPETEDDLLDLPLPVYRALVEHAGKLLAASQQTRASFTVDGLPDDLDDADPDLPTSA